MSKHIVPPRGPETQLSARPQFRLVLAGALAGLAVGCIGWLLSGDSIWFVAVPLGGLAFRGVAGDPPFIIR